MTDCDFLVVGHGLAGATLAGDLRLRGHRVLVYDAGRPDSASRVAAGLVNPVAGRRFALAWRAAELIPYATDYYRALEARLGQSFFTAAPIFKVFGSAQEQADTVARSGARPWGDFVGDILTHDPGLPGVRAPHGGAWLRHGGYLAVAELLGALATEGLAAGWLRCETFDWEKLVSTPVGASSEFIYNGTVRAQRVVCCEGAEAINNPYFSWLPLTPNQGEVIDVECAGLDARQVLNRSAYVVPLGAGCFRVGATYRWPPFAEGPTADGRTELTSRLAALTDAPFAVVGQRAGVRPAVRDRKPLLGPHPAVPGLSFCGGYGSKGVVLAPRLAALMADWLAGRADLWPEVSLARYAALWPAPVAARS